MKILLTILLFSLNLFAQERLPNNEDPAKDIWAPFRYFVGEWDGHETGKAGIGKGSRSYELIMEETYLYMRNISKFEPQEKNPKGERHEDWTFFSYDKNRGLYFVREFNIEGYVNEYILDSLSSDQKTCVFILESSENAPEGLRARLTYKIQGENEFEELFELAFPGKAYSEWLRNYWRRKE